MELKLRTARTRDWKLTLELHSGAGELYCLRDDPQEMENLFGSVAHAAIRKELADMIACRPDDALARPLQPSGTA